MSIEDWLPDEDPYAYEAEEVRCSRCGERHLYWSTTSHGPLLVGEDGNRHVCRINPRKEFTDLGDA